MKKILKRTLSAVITATMVLSLNIPAFANNNFERFADLNGHWSKDVTTKLLKKGIVHGYNDNSLKLDNTITRAEFATLVNSTFGYTDESTETFADIAGDEWYASALSKAKKAGYMIGDENQKAHPNQNILRQDAALVISRILQLNATKDTELNDFDDENKIANYAKQAMKAVVKNNIFKGHKNKLHPRDYMTRAEAFAMIERALQGKSLIHFDADHNYVINHGTVAHSVYENVYGNVYGNESDFNIIDFDSNFMIIDMNEDEKLTVKTEKASDLPEELKQLFLNDETTEVILIDIDKILENTTNQDTNQPVEDEAEEKDVAVQESTQDTEIN